MEKTRIHKLTTIAQSEMRAINRSAVLEYLRLAKKASRTELSVQLRISKPTAMRIIDELVADGWVVDLDQKEKGSRRSREMLALNTHNNLVIGVDLGGSHISGVIADIGGEIIHQIHVNQKWQSPTENYAILVEFIQALEVEAHKNGARTLGIAIGVPGIVDSKSGLVRIAPSLNWRDFPLLEKLQQKFSLPVIIENDVNLAALGENWFGAGVGVANMVMISIGTGIGSGIILDGKLHRGFRESSGEIGYLLPGIQYLDNQYPGFGALESLASCRASPKKPAGNLRRPIQNWIPQPSTPPWFLNPRGRASPGRCALWLKPSIS